MPVHAHFVLDDGVGGDMKRIIVAERCHDHEHEGAKDYDEGIMGALFLVPPHDDLFAVPEERCGHGGCLFGLPAHLILVVLDESPEDWVLPVHGRQVQALRDPFASVQESSRCGSSNLLLLEVVKVLHYGLHFEREQFIVRCC